MKLAKNGKLLVAALLVMAIAGGGAYVLAGSNDVAGKPSGSSEPKGLPDGWKECVNEKLGYRIGYPATWFTASLDASGVCMLFDAKPIKLTRGSEWPLVGMEAVLTGEKFAQIVANRVDEEYFKTVTRKSVTVAGKNALLIETIANGEDGLFGKGTVVYGYVVELDGNSFIVQTAIKSGADAAAAKKVIDTAATTLRFAAK